MARGSSLVARAAVTGPRGCSAYRAFIVGNVPTTADAEARKHDLATAGTAHCILTSNLMLLKVLVKLLLVNQASLVQQRVRKLYMVLVKRIVQNSGLPVAVFEHLHPTLCVAGRTSCLYCR